MDPQTYRLRAMPAVALQALQRMSDPELGVAELTDILKNDPAIVSRLLAVANSAACGLQTTVTDLQQVIALLGKPAVVSIVMSIALAPPEDIPAADRVHYRRYWRDAVTMATSAEQLAKSAPVLTVAGVNPAEYFTAGLLSDVGRLALLQSKEFRYGSVLEEAGSKGEFPRDTELRVLGTTHVSASVILLNSWNAPQFIIDAVNQHHATLEQIESHQGANGTALTNTLLFSAATVDYLNHAPKAELLEYLMKVGRKLLGLSEEEVEKHIESVLDRLTETADLFTIHSTDIEDMRGQFVRGLEQTAMSAAAEHIQAQTAELLGNENRELTARLQAVTVRASRDGLTGAFNRDYFEACLDQYISDGDSDLGLIFIDIDNFKEVNDSYGHSAGDTVLRGVVGTLQDSLRSSDMLGRFGGDEFVLLLHNANAPGLQKVAERLQQRVATTVYGHEGIACSVTISVGGVLGYVGSLPKSSEEFLSLADAAMYEAKISGKNRVHVCEPPKPRLRMRDHLLSKIRKKKDRGVTTPR
ncbi:MAG: diguanylate cyclase [Planctomycetaceae bacterium]